MQCIVTACAPPDLRPPAVQVSRLPCLERAVDPIERGAHCTSRRHGEVGNREPVMRNLQVARPRALVQDRDVRCRPLEEVGEVDELPDAGIEQRVDRFISTSSFIQRSARPRVLRLAMQRSEVPA